MQPLGGAEDLPLEAVRDHDVVPDCESKHVRFPMVIGS